MSQVSVYSMTAQGRLSWRALRPLLLLGGFVAIWWALMTGVAQADSSPHHLVDSVKTQVKAHHDSPVRKSNDRVHHDAKATSPKATSKVRQHAKPVGRTVAPVVQTTPVPVATQATKTIRTTVSDTVAKTRSPLAKTAAGPVVDTVQDAAKHPAEMHESSTGQGNSPTSGPSAKAHASSFADLLSSALGQQSATTAGPDQAMASSDAGTPVNGPRGTPPVHDPCASPGGSSSSSFTPVGISESSLLVMPSVLRDHHTGRLARLPGGPAYVPGSSPD